MTVRWLRPGSAEYEAARRPAMPRYGEVHPAAIAQCATPAEVADVLAEARRTGQPVVPRSGGHCFAGRSTTTGIVLDVSPMASIDVTDRMVRVGAGVRLPEVYDALDEVGLTLPAGCGETVGIAGLVLGGGIGLLGRMHGLTSDKLIAAELVLADGRVVRCAPDEHADLFWAIRGAGGGQFGVVTKLWFTGVPSPSAHRLHLTWPRDHAVAVVDAWQRWAPYAPDEVNVAVKVTTEGVHVFGLVVDDLDQVDRLVVAVGSEPATTAIARMPYRELKRSVVGLGDVERAQPRLDVSKSAFFAGSVPGGTWRELLASLGDAELNLTPMGGEYNRHDVDWSAFAHRDQAFLVELVTGAPLPSGEEALRTTEAELRSALAGLFRPLEQFSSGRVYPNFPDPTLPDALTAYHGENLDRLRKVKQAYDPDGFFAFPQSITPAAS
ncbi:FAD-binding oxidoreductase [Kribbella sp. NPDC050470]|uniref:FAD-binding oxidoreductase n=1 Tax=unclassified Kribbella TaxID=2644121 RepID=UPI0037B03C3A